MNYCNNCQQEFKEPLSLELETIDVEVCPHCESEHFESYENDFNIKEVYDDQFN